MHYLWLDLETTGLDPYTDAILEVGIAITDDNLIVKADPRRYIVNPGFDWVAEADPFVVEMHRKSGLLAELQDPYNHYHYHHLIQVERSILGHIEPYLEGGKIVLAGSGVGTFDLQFLKVAMPELAQRLTYYVLDVGVVRRFFGDVCRQRSPELGPVTHRALDDVEHALEQARYFQRQLMVADL